VKLSQAAGIGLALVAGFVAGRLTSKEEGKGAGTEGKSSGALGERRAEGSRAGGGSPDTESSRGAGLRASERPRGGRAGEENDKALLIPVDSLAEILQSRSAFFCTFDNMAGPVGETLDFLGASPQDKRAVLEIIGRVSGEFRAAEKIHGKASQVSDSEIVIDLRAMEEPAKLLAEKAREDIRAALPTALGTAVVGSINWPYFYYRGEEPEYTFKILKEADGKLSRWIGTHSGMSTSHLDPALYPEEGKGVPAGEVFDERWQGLLAGKTLLPVPAAEGSKRLSREE